MAVPHKRKADNERPVSEILAEIGSVNETIDRYLSNSFVQTQYVLSTSANAGWPGYDWQADARSGRITRGKTYEYDAPRKPLFTPDLKLNIPEKEKPVPTEQQEIDDAVKEAIAAPRREREIARRVAAVTALEHLADAEEGAVLRFKRTYSAKTYTYAAVYVGDRWYLTGTMAGSTGSFDHEALIEWMTTGQSIVTEVEIADAWTTVL